MNWLTFSVQVLELARGCLTLREPVEGKGLAGCSVDDLEKNLVTFLNFVREINLDRTA